MELRWLKLILQILSSRLALAIALVFASIGEAQETKSAEAFVIEIRGTTNPATSRYLSRTVGIAEEAKAEFVLVELDTPGGLVSSVREMAQTIDRSKIPVIVYTNPAGAAATSAGAILMISSHFAAMAPGTNIGAAHPVGAQGEDIKGAWERKLPKTSLPSLDQWPL